MWKLLVLLFIAGAFCSNPEENAFNEDPDLFEGDMILDPVMKLEIELGMEVGSLEAGSRKAYKYRRWPNPKGGVPYTIDRTLVNQRRATDAIRAAFDEYKQKTCIRFKPRTNEAAYITFRLGKGCSSSIGRTGKQQFVNLARGCWRKGTIVHEIGHALGFFHEQSRPDRDNYVKINWENIKDGKSGNFKKYSVRYIDNLGEPYNYGSVMHYGRTYFTKNRKPTIETLKPGVTIGQRREMSAGDARQISKMYC